jgi:anaerobic magnesium-protoporphyrin IX monomethyl ester cyclase
MKILFVYPGYIVREVPLNVMYVSASVKAAGHESRLFHFSPYRRLSWTRSAAERIEEGFIETMRDFNPDIVGFSVMVQDYGITKRLSDIAGKTFRTPVIWGGIQPILEPERSIGEAEVDYICTGEGEYAFVEFLERLERGRDPFTVPGIWAKDKKGNIHRNDRPDLVGDLDGLPFPDRDLLDPEYYRAELTGANILTARGCPFPCSFCQNKALIEHYRGKGKFIRYRGFDNVFREMEEVIDKYGAPSFYFSDEMFTLDRRRAIEFCREYKRRIKKPFMIQTRADYMDEELARVLAEAGCFMVNMAIESGNEHIRNVVLKKNIPSERIIEAYRLVRDYGMMASSFNMIGVPGETVDTIWETIEVNRRLKPDRILCSIFMPLPGTELGDYCRDNGLMTGDVTETTNYYSQVTVRNPDIPPRTLIGYQGFFDWFVLLPRGFHWAVHALRVIYQSLVPPRIPDGTAKRKLRETIIETVYQMKRFLPQKKLHVKAR